MVFRGKTVLAVADCEFRSHKALPETISKFVLESVDGMFPCTMACDDNFHTVSFEALDGLVDYQIAGIAEMEAACNGVNAAETSSSHGVLHRVDNASVRARRENN